MTKKPSLIKLYDLSKGAEIRGIEFKPEGNRRIKDAVVVFDHIDGMYSYNTVKTEDGKILKDRNGNAVVVHLANTVWLKKVGKHYVMASEEEIQTYGSSN